MFQGDEAAKDLIGFVRSCCFCALIRGLQNLEAFQKDLILLVRGRCLGELIRGLQNLGAPGEGVRIGTFCGVQKVPQKHAEGCDPLDSRGAIQISARYEIFGENDRPSSCNRPQWKPQGFRVSPVRI